MRSASRKSQTYFSNYRIAKTRFISHSEKAFTLLEIMMVVIIIGIMVSLVVPRLSGQRDQALINQAKNQIDSLKTTLKSYDMEVGRFPSTDEGLQALVEKPGDVDEQDWHGPYLDPAEVPKDPWKNDYQYVSPGQNSKDFDLWSFGPDKQDGTDDDITNWKKK